MSVNETLIAREFRERIVLVGVALDRQSLDDVESSLDELSLLIDTAGADEVARIVQRRDRPDPATYIGQGKAEEVRQISLDVDSDTVVFDDELSPAQQRNLQKILGRTAIDRTAVILDIFAQNAHTQEGKAQVELALLRYRLPRLRGRGVTLSQQAGGIGTRGPGETQLEVDRRRLLRRITRLEKDLKALSKTRGTQRKSRSRSRLHTVTLVGYTNAGKSTLLNKLTEAGALVEDRLFSTLDPLTRRMQLPGGESILLSDTVGFVRKLPHQLVEAFQSTLEEVTESDLLVHVVDASVIDPVSQMEAVRKVLKQIGAGDVPEFVVFNKADALSPEAQLETKRLMASEKNAVLVSAGTGEGIDDVIEGLSSHLRTLSRVVELVIPYARGDVVAALYRDGQVLDETHEDNATRLVARLEPGVANRFEEFVTK